MMSYEREAEHARLKALPFLAKILLSVPLIGLTILIGACGGDGAETVGILRGMWR